MVYTKKSPALLILGLIMLAIWYLADSGMIAPYLEHLAAGKKYKYGSELTQLPLYFGIISVVIGAWQQFGSHKEGHWDYYSSTIAGGMFILLIAMLVVADPCGCVVVFPTPSRTRQVGHLPANVGPQVFPRLTASETIIELAQVRHQFTTHLGNLSSVHAVSPPITPA